MIARYTLPGMGALWTDQARFEFMLRVELAALRALGRRGTVPQAAVAAVEGRARIDVDRIAELEQTTDHGQHPTAGRDERASRAAVHAGTKDQRAVLARVRYAADLVTAAR